MDGKNTPYKCILCDSIHVKSTLLISNARIFTLITFLSQLAIRNPYPMNHRYKNYKINDHAQNCEETVKGGHFFYVLPQ